MAANLAIEFTDVDCKIAYAERGKGGRVGVRTLVSFELPKEENADNRVAQRAQLLRDALKAQKLKPQAARIVIPKNFVMARAVTLPSTDENEIVGMARFEAERHIPFNAERHIVSHHTLAKQGVQGSDVLLAAVDLPIAQEYVDICTKAGLSIETISVSSLAAFNAFAAAEPTAMDGRVVAVVNIGRAGTDLVIASNGIVNFTRGSTLGLNKLLHELGDSGAERQISLQDLPQIDALEPHLFFRPGGISPPPQVTTYDELHMANSPAPTAVPVIAPSDAVAPENKGAVAFRNWLMRVLQEVKRTYEFAHREFNIAVIDHIYLCGEGTAINNLSQYFRVNFSVEASIFDPLRGTQASKKLSAEMRARAQAFAAPIGALVADSTAHSIQVNLLPTEYLQRRMAKKQQRSYIISGVLVLAALGMGYWYMADVFQQRRELLSELIDMNAKDKKRVSELEAKKQRLEIIRSNVQEGQSALDVLEKLSEIPLIPTRASLTKFEYKKGDYVKVAGLAKDIATANLVAAELRKMQTPDGRLYFEDAKMDSEAFSQKTPRGKGTETVFEYSATASFPKKKKKGTSSQSSDNASASDSSGGSDGTK